MPVISKMKKLLRKTIYKGISMSQIHRFIKPRRGATVLFYHGVDETIVDQRIQCIQMPLSAFERQIKYLKSKFEIISLDYLHDCLKNAHRIHPRQVVITFDDGYKNNRTIVGPLLRSYSIPFTVFISTHHIDTEERFPAYYPLTSILYTDRQSITLGSIGKQYNISTQDRRIRASLEVLDIMKSASMGTAHALIEELRELLSGERWDELNHLFSSEKPMNWDDVRELKSMGAEIGSHCHEHMILHDNQIHEKIIFQLQKSRELIEKKVGSCKYFSYPNGRPDDIAHFAVNCVGDYGYLLAFTTIMGEITGHENPLYLPRIGGDKRMDILKIDLSTRWRYKVRMLTNAASVRRNVS